MEVSIFALFRVVNLVIGQLNTWPFLRVETQDQILLNTVVVSCRKILASWKAKLFINGGMITLVKVALSNLSVYFSLTIQIPKE